MCNPLHDHHVNLMDLVLLRLAGRGSHRVAQASLELFLPQSPSAGITGMSHLGSSSAVLLLTACRESYLKRSSHQALLAMPVFVQVPYGSRLWSKEPVLSKTYSTTY